MNETFELIKKSEQDGDLIVSSAREKISDIKKELAGDIKKIETSYQTQLDSLKDELQQKEKDHIHLQKTQMDQKLTEDIDGIKQAFLDKKKDLLHVLIGKVMDTNGHSSY